MPGNGLCHTPLALTPQPSVASPGRLAFHEMCGPTVGDRPGPDECGPIVRVSGQQKTAKILRVAADQEGFRITMSLSLIKNCAEHSPQPQMTGSTPAICLRVIRPNVPQLGQDRTAQ